MGSHRRARGICPHRFPHNTLTTVTVPSSGSLSCAHAHTHKRTHARMQTCICVMHVHVHVWPWPCRMSMRMRMRISITHGACQRFGAAREAPSLASHPGTTPRARATFARAVPNPRIRRHGHVHVVCMHARRDIYLSSRARERRHAIERVASWVSLGDVTRY